MEITAQNTKSTYDSTLNLAKGLRFLLLASQILPGMKEWKGIPLQKIQEIAAKVHLGMVSAHGLVTVLSWKSSTPPSDRLHEMSDMGLFGADVSVGLLALNKYFPTVVSLSKGQLTFAENALWTCFIGGSSALVAGDFQHSLGFVPKQENPVEKDPKTGKPILDANANPTRKFTKATWDKWQTENAAKATSGARVRLFFVSMPLLAYALTGRFTLGMDLKSLVALPRLGNVPVWKLRSAVGTASGFGSLTCGAITAYNNRESN